MKLEDILAPYQYDAQNPPRLLGGFESEIWWRGAKKRLRIARIQFNPESNVFYIFWRIKGDDGAWCLTHRTFPHPQQLWKTWASEDTNEQWLQRVRSFIGYKAFCRLLFMPQEKRYVTLKASEGVFYTTLDAPPTAFHLNWSNIKYRRCSETKTAFEGVLSNEESDAYFALRMAKLSVTGARALAFGFDDINKYDEYITHCKSLIAAVLRCSDSLWSLGATYKVHVASHERYQFVSGHTIAPHITGSTFVLNGKDEYWIDLVKRFDSFLIDPERRQKHRSLAGPYQYAKLLSFEISAPTFHERLEAKLQLLEWAKNHLPPEKYIEVEAMET